LALLVKAPGLKPFESLAFIRGAEAPRYSGKKYVSFSAAYKADVEAAAIMPGLKSRPISEASFRHPLKPAFI
jgi:hypothetical protein